MKKYKRKESSKVRRLLTRSEAAEEFDVSLVTIDNWTRNGAPYQEIEGRRMYDEVEMVIWTEFYKRKSSDADFAETMKRPIKDLADNFFGDAHAKIWGWIVLNAGPRQRSEVKKRLAQISKLANEIALS